jgi:GDP-L-fucose synthase
MKKLFITGSSGFIGKNFKEQFTANYDIYSPSSKELNLLDPMAVEEFITKNNFDVIIHSATWDASRNSCKDPCLILNNNLRMFYNIARLKDHFGKLISLGSGAEYSRFQCHPNTKEDFFDTFVPPDDYGFSKYIISKYIEKSDNIYNLRLFGIFGKYEDWEIRFISNACCKALYDMPITIKQNVVFDYLWINDFVKICDWFINNSPSERIFNATNGKKFDLITLAKKVLKASGKNLEIIINKEGMGSEYSADNKKLLNTIPNLEFTDIDISIHELYQWYENNKNIIDKTKLLYDK